MAETPDFEEIAKSVLIGLEKAGGGGRPVASVKLIVTRLHQVWNARGAADIATLEAEVPGAYTKNLDRALRKLDR